MARWAAACRPPVVSLWEWRLAFCSNLPLRCGRRGGAWRGLGLASALAGCAVVETLTVNMYFQLLYRISLHLKVLGRRRDAP